MKTVRAESIDSIDDYRLIEVETPAPAAGQILIEVHSCGMGYVDALVALGRYQVKPPTPFTPGLEIGGVVAAVGAGVSQFRPGDRVMASAFGGGLAEYAVAAEETVRGIPAAMSFAQAAGFRTNYVTALHGLTDRAALQPGERLLVLGAAGGVGVAAVQVGTLLGAEIIAAASTPAKRAFAQEHGAQHLLDTEPEGWRERLKAACGGAGPDVVFDPVCGPLFEPAFRSQSWRGRHLVVGFAGGPIPKLPVNLPLMKGAALVGVDVRQFFLFEAEHAQSHLAQLLAWVEDGRLAPPVGRRFPLASFAEAMEFALSGQGWGKTIIDIAD
ncbi:NADPH:quinone oxidoreductase family protein [Chelatococcus reniformis]|uniref:Oxidoreductase n=1 Tax=Chelatococcus reniformis TaxID=1494448 RepID=A0A916TWZ9_9HYPH|nr:NADPH:quinone oxidoreductase family protein [Chelatococcus reniformis]GGC49136.1 oxidoreductase [Chelatococcus reniformis]